MQLRACSPKLVATIVRRSGGKKAAGSFSGTSRINDVQLCPLAGVGGKTNKVVRIDVFKARLSYKTETDTIAERKVMRSGFALGGKRSAHCCKHEKNRKNICAVHEGPPWNCYARELGVRVFSRERETAKLYTFPE